MTNYEEQECPLCGDCLEFHKEGTMKNKDTGEILYVFICEGCDQAFVMDENDTLNLIPYNSEMKLIENKCKNCGKIENYNEKGIFLLNINTAIYEFYCFDCVIPILQDWINKNGDKKTEVTMENVNMISDMYDFTKTNEMMEKLNKDREAFDKMIKNLEN